VIFARDPQQERAGGLPHIAVRAYQTFDDVGAQLLDEWFGVIPIVVAGRDGVAAKGRAIGITARSMKQPIPLGMTAVRRAYQPPPSPPAYRAIVQT
jgi:hypothetical protein